MLESLAYHLVGCKEVGRGDTLTVWRIHNEETLVGRTLKVLEVSLLHCHIFCKAGSSYVQTCGVYSLHVDVVAIDVMVELTLIGIVVVDAVEQVGIEIVPLLESELLAEYARTHVVGYQGCFHEKRTRTAHGVDEVGFTLPSGHKNHSCCQNFVQWCLYRFLAIATTVQRFST